MEKKFFSSWKFHALVIGLATVCSIPIFEYFLDTGRMTLQQLFIITNMTNLLALVYAIYIYSIYDRSKNKAITELEGSGIKVQSLEEGISAMLSKVQELYDWLEGNKSAVNKMFDKVKKVDLEKLIADLENMVKTVEYFDSHGYNKEQVVQLMKTVEKINWNKIITIMNNTDFEKLNEFIAEIVERQKLAQNFKELDKLPQSSESIVLLSQQSKESKLDATPSRFFPLRKKKIHSGLDSDKLDDVDKRGFYE